MQRIDPPPQLWGGKLRHSPGRSECPLELVAEAGLTSGAAPPPLHFLFLLSPKLERLGVRPAAPITGTRRGDIHPFCPPLLGLLCHPLEP